MISWIKKGKMTKSAEPSRSPHPASVSLVPTEIVGGSQREERLDVLLDNFKKHDLDPETYGWYADLRKYGSVPHAGFGLGFERMLMFVTGMANIRDVIPFARTPGNCEF